MGQKRGRKRTSCDQCSQTHTVCDGECPCEACLAASVDCSYNALKQPNPSPSVPIEHQFAEPEVSVREAGQESTNPSQKISIPFLLNYTNQSSKSSYDLHCILGGESSGFTDDSFPASADSFTDLWSSLFRAFINPSAIEPKLYDTAHYYGLDDLNGLADTIERLESHLERCNTGSLNPQQVDISEAKSFFCNSRLGEYVHSFFDHSSHTNCIIHRASFNVNKTSTHLLLVIILLGAVCMSPEDAVAAQNFSDLVQRSVLEGPDFQRMLYIKHPPRSKDNIQLVQAALLVTVLQSGKEEFEVNRRIHTQWFPALISVIRSLGLTQEMNGIDPRRQEASLDDYIYQEILVRMMAWAYLLDSYNVIFYRSSPQFKMIEAGFGLPRNDPLFDAMDPVECENTAAQPQHSPCSLRSIVQRLMDETPVQPKELLKHIDTSFALSLILSAIHSVLFDIQALAGCIDTLAALKPIQRALNRWKELYDLLHSETHASKPLKAGFMEHSLEFWWLANEFVRRPEVALNQERFAADSIASFHATVQDLKGANANI
ncbi:hypothetical protein P170DRAFT_402660 [Aspergillus steynii IBT 23096]|uniref:Zn(2)-C6 fungal-type domain-containing protein n=1 Tax=Aspergillus steynii IBT 23096 TaxID=1392250 RepID=A0A2I2GHU5_9EURO|nr:uncharacterized protein P170DRAFT_402660 [Aspergillus steynii IBT 23096]PLB52453.1 hypothetical protein P170DRAFT_402660 [Aspergillus steynii IBT 23096]